jgi:type II secretory pathway predicted ATPase ExeA
LKPLNRGETHAYVHHRIKTAGGDASLFSPEAIEFMYAHTNGVPRLLNHLGDFALVYGYADGRATIDVDLISQVLLDRSGGHSLPTFPSVDPTAAGITNGSAA